jgi:L-histidine Nalpha-methyltransferase
MIAPLAVKLQERLEILSYLPQDASHDTGDDVVVGMLHPQKSIPSKYFYDAHGSRLFEKICRLPEYYLTRTELSILEQSAGAIMAFFTEGPGDLIELGSGSNQKIQILLNAIDSGALNKIRYVPVDICAGALHEASQGLLELYEDLQILGIIADLTKHLGFLPHGRKLITFLGSTIGNLFRKERATFLRNVAACMNPEDLLIVGLDMVKPVSIIWAAYNDSQKVTAEFNKNILNNLNCLWQADFKIDDFEHLAFYSEATERIEMHLKARQTTSARITALHLSVDCCAGETIRTEICQKFSQEGARQEFQEAGLTAVRWFTDPKNWFSVVMLEKV